MSAVTEPSRALGIAARTEQSMAFLTVDGVLDVDNSAALRDSIAMAARDRPAAVIVDVNRLHVSSEAACNPLIGIRFQGSIQPRIPVVLVCATRATCETISRAEVARFLPVYSTEKAARKAVQQLRLHTVRHCEAQLPADLTSLRESRRLVREWLTTWSQSKLIPVALVVVNVFVENVLKHTGSFPAMRIESDDATATIAVSDASKAAAVRLPSPSTGIDVSGLAIVDALSRAWGSTPTASGKTVWAVIGPESRL